MAIIYQKDRKTGRTYAFERHTVPVSEQEQPTAEKKLLGVLDEDTGEIIPLTHDNSGETILPDPVFHDMRRERALQEEIDSLLAQNRLLLEVIQALHSSLQSVLAETGRILSKAEQEGTANHPDS